MSEVALYVQTLYPLQESRVAPGRLERELEGERERERESEGERMCLCACV